MKTYSIANAERIPIMKPKTDRPKASEFNPALKSEPGKSRVPRSPGKSPPIDDHCTHSATSTALPATVKTGVTYTCPMHSQIRQTGPGNCPLCGMTLEPVKATEDVDENRELYRHDTAVLGWAGADFAGLHFGNGRPHSRGWPG